MPSLVFKPFVPTNPGNYSVPARICMWWQSICPDGSLDTAIDLGSVSDIEFTPNETILELKSARLGSITTDKRLITDVSGSLTFQLHEVVGTNLLLLFRPVTSTSNTVAGANAVTLFGQSRVRLDGTTAVNIGGDAVEYDSTNGVITRPSLTILRVESSTIEDNLTGRGTAYTAATDYTFTNVTGAGVAHTISGVVTAAGAVTATNTQLIGTAIAVDNTNFQFGAIGDTIVAAQIELFAYDGGNGTLPVSGEAITVGGIARVIIGHWGNGTDGYVLLDNAGGAAIADNDAFVGPTSGHSSLINGAALVDPSFTMSAIGTLTTSAFAFTLAVTAGGITDAIMPQLTFMNFRDLSDSYQATSSVATGATTQATLARVATGAITDGAEVIVHYTYQRDGVCHTILDGVIVEGKMQLQIFSVNGPQSVYIFNRVSLSIDGAISINPEERFQPTLNCAILPDSDGVRGQFCLLNGFSGFSLTTC